MTTGVERLSIGGVQVVLFKYQRALKYFHGDYAALDCHAMARFEFWLATGEELDTDWEVFNESNADTDARLKENEQMYLFVNKNSLSEFIREAPEYCADLPDFEQILFFTFKLWRKPSADEIHERYVLPWEKLIAFILEKS